MARRSLSKTRLLSARQCLKRIHLEAHRPELAVIDAETQQALDAGRAVGAIARRIYATEAAVTIPYQGGLRHALQKSARLLEAGPSRPMFEATVEHGGVLVRVDILLPDGDAWQLVEVKAATRVEPHHYFDCAVQDWVLCGAGYPVSRVALAHVDRRFVYRGDGNYRGMLKAVDVTASARELGASLPDWVRRARDAIAGAAPRVAVGAHCFTPHDCPFIEHCWPTDVAYPLLELPRVGKGKLGQFVAAGFADVRDVPAELLTDTQRRVQRVARSGRAEVSPSIGRFVRSLPYPRYYLDFESVAPPVPIFADTRPYEALPFQWSCHFEAAAGELDHAEFLDLSGEAPFRRVAESLIRALGKSGPILVYSHYERTMLGRLGARFPDLEPALLAIEARLVDLKPIVENGYYHPGMRGSWSIKAVVPSIAPDMQYSELSGIQQGTEASSGYLEAIDPATSAVRKAELEAQLKRYCRFDTEALVRLVHYFGDH